MLPQIVFECVCWIVCELVRVPPVEQHLLRASFSLRSAGLTSVSGLTLILNATWTCVCALLVASLSANHLASPSDLHRITLYAVRMLCLCFA